MDLEKLINLIISNSNIEIQYSNIDGEEKLIVNGEEFPKKIDTTAERVKKHEDILKEIDECIFSKGVNIIKNKYDLLTINNLLEQDSYTEAEKGVVNEFLDYSEDIYKTLITEKISKLENILNKF